MMKTFSYALLLPLVAISQAHAHTSPGSDVTESATLSQLNGIIAGFRCSGALVTLGRADHERALVLTAGHCPSREPFYPEEAVSNQVLKSHDEAIAVYPPTQIVPEGSRPTIMPFWIHSIIYSTLTVSDIAVYEIEDTIGSLKSRGLRFFKIAKSLPKVGQRLRITSGLAGLTETCTVSRFLRTEADEKKIFSGDIGPYRLENSLLMDEKCFGKEGWSGSPLFDDRTGLIYGVMSRVRSDERNPPGAPRVRVIGSNMAELNHCFTPQGQLALDAPNCHLPPPMLMQPGTFRTR